MHGSTDLEADGDPTARRDDELIRSVAEGCEESFTFLFRRWAPRLGRFLWQATGSRETADDLLQETFLRVLRSAPRFEAKGRASAWMYRISANLVYSHWRKEQVRIGTVTTLAAEGAPPTAPVRMNPELHRWDQAFRGAAEEAMDRLPANQRLVFLLKARQGLTCAEIADILACPIGTVKSRLRLGVLRLREELREWGECPAKKGDLDVL